MPQADAGGSLVAGVGPLDEVCSFRGTGHLSRLRCGREGGGENWGEVDGGRAPPNLMAVAFRRLLLSYIV